MFIDKGGADEKEERGGDGAVLWGVFPARPKRSYFATCRAIVRLGWKSAFILFLLLYTVCVHLDENGGKGRAVCSVGIIQCVCVQMHAFIRTNRSTVTLRSASLSGIRAYCYSQSGEGGEHRLQILRQSTCLRSQTPGQPPRLGLSNASRHTCSSSPSSTASVAVPLAKTVSYMHRM